MTPVCWTDSINNEQQPELTMMTTHRNGRSKRASKQAAELALAVEEEAGIFEERVDEQDYDVVSAVHSVCVCVCVCVYVCVCMCVCVCIACIEIHVLRICWRRGLTSKTSIFGSTHSA